MFRKVIHAYRDSISGLSREVWILSAALFINRSGSMVLAFLTLYMTNELGFSVASAGLIFSVYGVGAICGAYASGRLVDRLGAVRIQIVCLLVSAPLYLLVPVFETFAGVALAVFLLALFNEAVRPANATAVAQFSKTENTIRAFGLQRLAINLGMSFGPAIGGLLAEIDYYWLFLVDAITTLLGAAILFRHFGLKRQTQPSSAIPSEPNEADHVQLDPEKQSKQRTAETLAFRSRRPWWPVSLRPAVTKPAALKADASTAQLNTSPLHDRQFVYFLGLMLLSAIVFFQFNAIYPKYLEEHYHLTPKWIGLVFAVNTVLIVLFEMLLLNWARSWIVLKTIGWGCFFTCLGFGLLPFGTSFWFLIATMIVLTLGEMLSAPLSSGYVAMRSRSRNQGRSQGMYMGWYTMTFALGAVLAPAMGGMIYQYDKDAFWYLAMLIGVLTLAGFYWLNHAGNSK